MTTAKPMVSLDISSIHSAFTAKSAPCVRRVAPAKCDDLCNQAGRVSIVPPANVRLKRHVQGLGSGTAAKDPADVATMVSLAVTATARSQLMAYENLIVETTDHVCDQTGRPDALNALNAALLTELSQALREAIKRQGAVHRSDGRIRPLPQALISARWPIGPSWTSSHPICLAATSNKCCAAESRSLRQCRAMLWAVGASWR